MLHPLGNLRRNHQMPFGAEIATDEVRFRLWAPKHDRIRLNIFGAKRQLPMRSNGDGWHELVTGAARPGSLYQFVLPDGLQVPDPASRFQPMDVDGPSEVIDAGAYQWCDADWHGRPWTGCVLYELHVGAFTAEGTFRAAIERLDYLHELGVTAIELMPIADFPGRWNWGYDGVLLFAPDSTYGRPEDLKALIDAAHSRGIAVLLDVVYNHFGPVGNYLPAYAPVFTEEHQTSWGAAVNFDGDGSPMIRAMIVENAVYWITEFNLDGLRLDAVHAIIDDSREHILDTIARRIRGAAGDRYVHLILENEENQALRLRRDADGRPDRFTAQWNDDLHHVLHAAASGESAGYYADYAGDTGKLGRVLAEGFAFQGEMMRYRGSPRGEPSAGLPPEAFVAFIQNHDQVGNRAFGDRLTSSARPEAVRAIVAVYLLAPQIPMLFMGEEWRAAEPFPFFCDFADDLAEAVRNGRRAEFAKFPEFQDPEQRERIPDPTARETFLSAKLGWEEATRGVHADWLSLYRRLLFVRRTEIIPRLPGMQGNSGQYQVHGPGAVMVHWTLGDGSRLSLAANLSAETLDGVVREAMPIDEPNRWPGSHAENDGTTRAKSREIFSVGSIGADRLGAWSVCWSLQSG
jgi:malto-oligosyltrehalose trehalohydrolase